MIHKVISGGQTGVDQAGLRAAKAVGLDTGGWMPRGFRTEAGPRPEFAGLYGCREHYSREYPPRTEDNVGDASATLWLSGFDTGDSLGFGCTARAARKFERPLLAIAPNVSDAFLIRRILDWLDDVQPVVLNVAGNRESKASGVGAFAEGILLCVFRELKAR